MKSNADLTRRRYRLYGRTWVLLVLAVAVLTVVNLPYEFGTVNQGLSSWMLVETGLLADEVDEIRYGGWPLRYLRVRNERYPELSGPEWSTIALAVDILVAMLLGGGVTTVYEWRQRRRKTRRWQVSLGDLCIVTLAVCCVLGTWNLMAYRYRNQQRAIQQIRINHGYVATRLLLPKLSIGPAERSPWRAEIHNWLVAQLWYYERPVSASVTQLDGDTIAALQRLPEIQTLLIRDPEVTAEAISGLNSLQRLERLEIDSEGMTDACAAPLLQMRNLRYLLIHNAPLSDDAITSLALRFSRIFIDFVSV